MSSKLLRKFILPRASRKRHTCIRGSADASLPGSDFNQTFFPARLQNRASLPIPPLVNVTQKMSPSLHAPNGIEPGPVPVLTKPSGVRSVAFHSETPGVTSEFVTNMRSPSNAAHLGWLNPLPISVAKAEPVDARTTDTLSVIDDCLIDDLHPEEGGEVSPAQGTINGRDHFTLFPAASNIVCS